MNLNPNSVITRKGAVALLKACVPITEVRWEKLTPGEKTALGNALRKIQMFAAADHGPQAPDPAEEKREGEKASAA